ncbi:MAG TPA: LysR family transcriptional regulator [Kofleriaceae bacterium]|jgi:DNA-binding transcriptional LysR family regulator
MAKAKRSQIHELDLNLLGVLDALLAERSVTRAADRIGLSQPAASHALRRLREHFGDPLLVKTARGMVLTERGRELAGPIHELLQQLDLTLRGARVFDARRAKRTFAIAMTDYLGVILLPSLYARIAREAPAIDLRIASIVPDIETALETEKIDLVLTMASNARDLSGVRQQRLFEDRYVCVMRRGHRAAARPLALDTYCTLDHVLIAPRGGRGVVDRELAARGFARRVAVHVSHWSAAPHLVAASELVLTVVDRFARAYASILPLEVAELPLQLPPIACSQRWHERSQHDAGHAWLRALVARVAAELTSPA